MHMFGTPTGRSVPAKTTTLLKQQGHIQKKQRAMNHSWMKQCCLWGVRKVFHTPSTGQHQFPPNFNQRKNRDMRKREDPHQEQEKNKGKKTGEELKENKLINLN